MTRKQKDIRHTNAAEVGAFYNETTDKFLAVYGEIIQAFRTNNVEDYLIYTMKSARFKNGERLLDAGCGVCGPAVFFAERLPEVKIEACTISSVQVEKAKANIQSKKLTEQVNVKLGDYHQLHQLYADDSFDCVYFLESFGHSSDKEILIDACWDVLKPGGRMYIKDLFRRESDDEWEQLKIDDICQEINDAYKYNIADIHQVIRKMRTKGFILKFLKVPDVETSEFEHLSISNDFQNLFDIGKIDSWEEYIFPIDFYEILAEKPKESNLEDMHLYFMNK